MRIQRSGTEHIAMYIDGAEVVARGWSGLDEARVRDLTDTALDELGLPSALPRVIESYESADGGALIFVSLHDGADQPVYYAFMDSDAMLDALRACAAAPEVVRCYEYGGLYIMALTGGGKPLRGLLPCLSEFGVRFRAGALAGAVLAEHGVAYR